MANDLCFVLMPFGRKQDISGTTIDFDAVYRDLIAPAVRESGLDPVRADEEMAGGVIHKPMFERLILCRFAVADLTTANANVFYELGVRHAVRPWSTVLVFSKGGSQLPFDVAPLRALPYTLAPDGTPSDVPAVKEALRTRLSEAQEAARRGPASDSPLYQLVDDYPDVDHTKTDVFREQVRYSEAQKARLAAARPHGADALRSIENELGDLGRVESAVVIDLFLSYRSVEAWEDMIRLVTRMPEPLAKTVMVQEQLALALNRAARGDDAERVLVALLQRRGPSSETYGILGRVYKDRWQAAADGGKAMQAHGLLAKAVDAYLKGFEADWRDAYPGINAVTLMELMDPPDPRRSALIPVVTYAVERRMASGRPDYWDHATLLELAVLARDETRAMRTLADTLAAVREPFEPRTTANNIRLIRDVRARRGEPVELETTVQRELASWAR